MIPPLVFLGYRAKRPLRDPAWDPERETGVEEICSVSDCLAQPPPDWIGRWDFNRAFCYPTWEAALASVPPGMAQDFVPFAYWILPARVDDGGTVPVELEALLSNDLPPLPPEPGAADYDVVGYDVAGATPGTLAFGCSPLSCNHLANAIPVNRYCLLDGLSVAMKKMFAAVPEARPNARMVELADRLLGRGGALGRAVDGRT